MTGVAEKERILSYQQRDRLNRENGKSRTSQRVNQKRGGGKETNSRRGRRGDRIIPSNLFLRVILVYSRESNKRCKYMADTFNSRYDHLCFHERTVQQRFVALKKMAEMWSKSNCAFVFFLFFCVQTKGEFFDVLSNLPSFRQARDYFRRYQKYERNILDKNCLVHFKHYRYNVSPSISYNFHLNMYFDETKVNGESCEIKHESELRPEFVRM